MNKEKLATPATLLVAAMRLKNRLLSENRQLIGRFSKDRSEGNKKGQGKRTVITASESQ